MPYYIEYARGADEARVVRIEGWLRFIFWLILHSRKCTLLTVYHCGQLPADEEIPCDTCLRWEECNGVDVDNCPLFQEEPWNLGN